YVSRKLVEPRGERLMPSGRRHSSRDLHEQRRGRWKVLRGEQVVDGFLFVSLRDVECRRPAMHLLASLGRDVGATMKEVREERVIPVGPVVRHKQRALLQE